jgi:hypothetical protein
MALKIRLDLGNGIVLQDSYMRVLDTNIRINKEEKVYECLVEFFVNQDARNNGLPRVHTQGFRLPSEVFENKTFNTDTSLEDNIIKNIYLHLKTLYPESIDV